MSQSDKNIEKIPLKIQYDFDGEGMKKVNLGLTISEIKLMLDICGDICEEVNIDRNLIKKLTPSK